jgi:hypothetical protein
VETTEEAKMRYMLTIIGEEPDWSDATPDDMRANMARWGAYTEELTSAGAMVAGEGLQPSATATTIRFGEGDERITVDGPFAETKEQVGGFYLIDVDDLDTALEWARKIPANGGGIEVRPVLDYEAMAGGETASAEVAS